MQLDRRDAEVGVQQQVAVTAGGTRAGDQVCAGLHDSVAGVRVVSLKIDTPQLPEPGGYRIVRFPYGAGALYDASGVHPANQPDGTVISD
ncbi:hypothetical protein [Streptomyces acidicola]|uniref:hypothetical protein n=1 Tax=Streptomyces acidicola TaxID=2596892 RepID=UPI0037F77C15